MANRVQIPAYTDNWMKGDRYGVVVKQASRLHGGRLVIHVKLDKSGRTIKVYSDDCQDI